MVAKRKRKKARTAPRSRKDRGRRLAVAMLFAFVLVCAGVGLYLVNRAPAEIHVPAVLAQTVGAAGSAPGALNSPRGLAVAPDGDLVVADLGNSRIEVFKADGTYESSFGVRGPQGGSAKPGEFNEPSGVAVGPDGTVYVADAWNGRVQKFDPKGKPLGEYGGARYSFYSPRNVATDRAGNLYVADTGNSSVKIIDPSGKLIKTLGGMGGGDGGVSREVFGVAVDSKGEIFVADHGNHRIHKFSALPAAEWIKDRKVPGWVASDPFWPELAVDRQDLLYAGDSGNGKIWVFDSDLNYRASLGGAPGPSPLSAPVGLAFTSEGNLWVADMGANRLFKLGPFTVPPLK